MDSAIKENDRANVERLLDRGADINAQNVHGMTPLHISILWNVPDITMLLLERGADVSKRDRSGSTPLHLAANKGIIKVINALLKKGADIDAADALGRSPMDYARNAKIRNHLRDIQTRRESRRVLYSRLPDVIRSQKANDQNLPIGQVRISKEWTEGMHGQPKKELPVTVIGNIADFVAIPRRGGRRTQRHRKRYIHRNNGYRTVESNRRRRS
jgi:hypothetical protein